MSLAFVNPLLSIDITLYPTVNDAFDFLTLCLCVSVLDVMKEENLKNVGKRSVMLPVLAIKKNAWKKRPQSRILSLTFFSFS